MWKVSELRSTTMRRHAAGKEEDVDSRGTLEVTDDDDDDDDDDVCEDDATIEHICVYVILVFAVIMLLCENIAMKTLHGYALYHGEGCTFHPKKLCLQHLKRSWEFFMSKMSARKVTLQPDSARDCTPAQYENAQMHM